MATVTNLCTTPDKIELDYNAGRIIGYITYGTTVYRMLLIHVLDQENKPIPDTFKMTAVNPSIY